MLLLLLLLPNVHCRPPSIAEDAKIQQQLWQLWEQQTGASFAPSV
jgi:hypothetical protein